MARLRSYKTNFVSGEFDPLMIGRSDIKYYFNAAKRMRNVTVIPEGGFSVRPGSDWLLNFPDVPEIDGGGVSNVRLVDFQFNTEQKYLFAFSHKQVRILRNGALVATLVTPWTSSDLWPVMTAEGDLIEAGISFAQDKDTLLCFHEKHATRQIKRNGGHALWLLSEAPFVNIPRYDFGASTYDNKVPATGSHPIGAGGTPANLVDGNIATLSTVNTLGDLTAASEAARRVAQIDLGASVQISAVSVSTYSITGVDRPGARVTYSADGATWFYLGDDFTFKAAAQSLNRTLPATCRYVAIVLGAANYTGQAVSIGEIEALPYTAGQDEFQEIEFPFPGSQGDWTEGDTFTLTLEDAETENIRFSLNARTMASRIEDALRRLSNTSQDGIQVFNAVKGAEFTASQLTNGTVFLVWFGEGDGKRPWGSIAYAIKSAEQIPSMDVYVSTSGRRGGEYVWSAARGYPRCGAFFGGRLWLGGTVDLPNWIWASRTTSVFDFNADEIADDYGIASPLDGSEVAGLLRIFVGRHLQVFTTSGEYYVPGSDARPVTPETFAMRRSTSRGIRPGLRVFDVDGGTHFVQRGGNCLREFIFIDTEQAYGANNISLVAPHLMRNPVDICLRRSTSTTDADLEFMPNTDGTMTVFCTLRTQEVNAYTLWQTQGAWHSVAAVNEEVYWSVIRTVNGTPVHMLERMNEAIHIDCAVSLSGAASTATLAHLPMTAIEHLLDGVIQPQSTADNAGLITFARPAVSSFVGGLRFAEPDTDYPGLIWCVATLPVQFELQDGPTFGKKRRVVGVVALLNNTSALSINGERIDFKRFGSGLLDQAVLPYTGLKDIRGSLGWDYEGEVLFGSDQSLAATVLAVNITVSI